MEPDELNENSVSHNSPGETETEHLNPNNAEHAFTLLEREFTQVFQH